MSEYLQTLPLLELSQGLYTYKDVKYSFSIEFI
jgi:hypothetical protein